MDDYFTFRNYNLVQYKENVTFDGIGHTVGVLNKDEDNYLFTETVEITGPAKIILRSVKILTLWGVHNEY